MTGSGRSHVWKEISVSSSLATGTPLHRFPTLRIQWRVHCPSTSCLMAKSCSWIEKAGHSSMTYSFTDASLTFLRLIFSTRRARIWRRDSLVERKAALRQMIHRLPTDSRLRFADHVEHSGVKLFDRVCKLDLEGIVAKFKFGPYGGDDALSTWYKIRNRNYSQMVGREKLFERDRHTEPVPGWHLL
jgi:hypothetical protein